MAPPLFCFEAILVSARSFIAQPAPPQVSNFTLGTLISSPSDWKGVCHMPTGDKFLLETLRLSSYLIPPQRVTAIKLWADRELSIPSVVAELFSCAASYIIPSSLGPSVGNGILAPKVVSELHLPSRYTSLLLEWDSLCSFLAYCLVSTTIHKIPASVSGSWSLRTVSYRFPWCQHFCWDNDNCPKTRTMWGGFHFLLTSMQQFWVERHSFIARASLL